MYEGFDHGGEFKNIRLWRQVPDLVQTEVSSVISAPQWKYLALLVKNCICSCNIVLMDSARTWGEVNFVWTFQYRYVISTFSIFGMRILIMSVQRIEHFNVKFLIQSTKCERFNRAHHDISVSWISERKLYIAIDIDHYYYHLYTNQLNQNSSYRND